MTMLLAYSDMAVLGAVIGLYAVLGTLWFVHWIIKGESARLENPQVAEGPHRETIIDAGQQRESQESEDLYCERQVQVMKQPSARDNETDEVAELRAELITIRETAYQSRTRLLELEEELEALRLRVADLEREDADCDDDLGETVAVLSLYEPNLEKYHDDWATADADLGVILAKRPEQPDDLTQIRGVDSVNQVFLNQNGIFYFQQIADWTKHNVDQFNELLAFKGRIEREQWVAQAQQLMTRPADRKAA